MADKLAENIDFLLRVLVRSEALKTDWKAVAHDAGISNANNT